MKFSEFQEKLAGLLDKDLQLLSSKHLPPKGEELDALIEAEQLTVPEDYRTFLLHHGGTIFQAHESAWPREIENGPSWSPHFSVMVFGLGDQIPDFLHLGKVARAYREQYSETKARITPFLRLRQSPDYLLFNPEGRIVKGKGDELLEVEGSFFEVVLDYVRQLKERKEEMKSFVRSKNAVRTTTKVVLPIPAEREKSMDNEEKVLENSVDRQDQSRLEEIGSLIDSLPYRDEAAWRDRISWNVIYELNVPSALPVLLNAARKCGYGMRLSEILIKMEQVLGDSADEHILEEVTRVVGEVLTLPRVQYFVASEPAVRVEQKVKFIRTLRSIDVRHPTFEQITALVESLPSDWYSWFSYFPTSFLEPLSRPDALLVLVEIGNKCGHCRVLIDALNLLCSVITPTTSDLKMEEVKKMVIRVRSRWIDCDKVQGTDREELVAALKRVEEKTARTRILDEMSSDDEPLRYT